MEWGAADNAVWFWVLPAAVILFLVASFRATTQMKRLGEISMIRKLVSSLSVGRRWLKRLLVLLALALIVIALCQPHFGKKEVTVDRAGVDILIVLDVSQSMLAKDMVPNRLEKAKLELADLIEKLKGDRLGIVAFAGDAIIQCPLTFDKSAIKLFLSTAHPNLIPRQGTAIAQAIRVATLAFADDDKSDKAMILLTDGEDHEEDPLESAKAAKKANIRIYPIGFGTGEGSTVPTSSVDGFKKDRAGQVVISKINEGLLKALAKETGGTYFRSSRGEIETTQLALEIRKMTQKGYGKNKSVEYDENFQFFLLAALILLYIEFLISERKEMHDRAAFMVLLLLICPFLFGFNFFSPVKNEEGNRYYQKGQIGKAKKAYTEAMKIDPDSPEIAFNLGNTFYKEESYDKSLDTYKLAAEKIKEPLVQSKAFYNLGNALVRKGDYPKAIEFYKQTLRLNPGDEDAKFNLELLMKHPPEPPKQNQQQKQDQNKDQKQNQQNQQQNQDQQKDQKDQNQDQKNQQDQKDQQDKQQNQQQNQDQQSQNQLNQNEDKKQQNQSGSDQKDENQKQEQGSQQEQKGQDQQDKGQKGQEEQKEEQKKGESQKENGKGDQKEEESQSRKDENGQDQAKAPKPSEEEEGEGPAEGEQPVPKTEAQKRAEQILNALENQERQVLKLQSSQNKPFKSIRMSNEKDW